MKMICATRGRYWVFRFLLDGGFEDPLLAYEEAFEGFEAVDEGCLQKQGETALRLLDPNGRTDKSGRIIPHDFVIFGDDAKRVSSLGDGLELIWPQVSEWYSRIWDAEKPDIS